MYSSTEYINWVPDATVPESNQNPFHENATANQEPVRFTISITENKTQPAGV